MKKFPDRSFIMVLDFGTMTKTDLWKYQLRKQFDVKDTNLHCLEIMSYNIDGRKIWSKMTGKYFVRTSEIIDSTMDFVDVEEACKAFDIYGNLQITYRYGLPSRYSTKCTKYELGSGLSLPYYMAKSIYNN